MSRHRAVRNLDLDEELADDYGYDEEDPYENIGEDDRASLDSAYATILDVLGPPDSSNNPFTEREIKDALWEAYFDTEAVLDELMKEAERRNKKKQDTEDGDATMEDGISQMSLDSPSSSSAIDSSRHSAGRGRGIAGLISRGGRGGRAGMAKRNLIALAPGGLPGVNDGRPFGPRPGDVGTRSPSWTPAPVLDASAAPSPASTSGGMSKLAMMAQRRRAGEPAAAESSATRLSPSKRPSDSAVPTVSATSSSASSAAVSSTASAVPARPSKLMALAQGRQAAQAASKSQTASEAPVSTSSPDTPAAKPLSKLQQKALAARLEREQKDKAAQQMAVDKDSEATAGSDSAEQPRAAELRILPGGLSEDSLFPSRQSKLNGSHSSDVTRILATSSATTEPPSSPSAPLGLSYPVDAIKDAFVDPSPDDKVLQARGGTKLGA